MRLGNDTKRMRNCNGLVVGLMSLVVRMFGFGGEKGTSLGAHRVLFLDQHHFCDHTTVGLIPWIRFFPCFCSSLSQAVTGVWQRWRRYPHSLILDIVY